MTVGSASLEHDPPVERLECLLDAHPDGGKETFRLTVRVDRKAEME
jgi:hypothetical protein